MDGSGLDAMAPEALAPAPSHDDLLRTAHHVWAVAHHEDRDELVRTLNRFRQDLVAHAAAESVELEGLPGATPGVARRGQERLAELVDQLLELATSGGHDALGRARAAELVQLLERQVRMETALRFRLDRR